MKKAKAAETRDLFEKVVVDQAKHDAIMAKPPTKRTFVIYFTARSGSTWLSEIILKTGRLGVAQELFNPAYVPKIAKNMGAKDLDAYIELAQRRFRKKGVFSFEITAYHIRSVFGTFDAFYEHYGSFPCLWLIREDIVAQAVSLAKMVKTRVHHAWAQDGDIALRLDSQFAYDGELVKKWLRHLLAAERLSEQWFAQHGIKPLRLSYERITALTPDQLIGIISSHIGRPGVVPRESDNPMTKLGTAQNTAFADRFRTENAAFIAEIDAARAPMLERLANTEDLVRALPR